MKYDRRRRQYAPLGVRFAHGKTGTALLTELGHSGLLAWVGMIAAAKRSPVQGTVEFVSDEDAWYQFGVLEPEPPAFTVDQLLDVLGRLKQTRRRRSGRVQYVTLTRFEDWNQDVDRELAAERMSRKRAEIARNNGRTQLEQQPNILSTEGEGEGEGEYAGAQARQPEPKKTIYPCPRCIALAFRTQTELTEHLNLIHDTEPQTSARAPEPAKDEDEEWDGIPF